MADMLARTRSVFRFPRAEADLAGVVLGAAGYVAYQVAWPVLASLLDISSKAGVLRGPRGAFEEISRAAFLRGAFFRPALRRMGFPGTGEIASLVGYPGDPVYRESGPRMFHDAPVERWKLVVVAVVLGLLMAVIAGAIARVYALRKARDVSIGVGDALAFSCTNLRSLTLGPAFIAAAIVACGGAVVAAGAGIAVPYAGPALQVVLQPLAILLALFFTLLVVGAALGLPLLVSAVAVERNGSLDAVSRTYSYLFARPVVYGFGSFLILAVAAVIRGFAEWFLRATEMLLQNGASWGGAVVGASMRAGFEGARTLSTPVVPAGDGGASLGGAAAAWTWITWGFATLALLAMRGFVVSYVIGAFVDLYYLLREDVEGIALSEVYVEGDSANLGDPIPGEPK